jgi:hypothetical protein
MATSESLNPVPAELQSAAKELHRLLSHEELWQYPEALKLEGAIMNFICINANDPLDDIPDDAIVHLDECGLRFSDGDLTIAADVEWLRRLHIGDDPLRSLDA